MEFQQPPALEGTFEEDVRYLVSENVTIPLMECQRTLHRTDGAICPLTITLYRSIAFRKLKLNLQKHLSAG